MREKMSSVYFSYGERCLSKFIISLFPIKALSKIHGDATVVAYLLINY